MSSQRFLDHEKMVPISRSSTEVFKTGSWSRHRPRFEEKSSPCNVGCPNANNIPVVLHRVKQGDYDGALAAFLEESPLPGVCGRVCDHRCQSRCNRVDYDGSVEIRSLERAVSDLGSTTPVRLTDAGTGLPVAVVGSGPAGISAAYHLARMGHPVTLIEERDRLGGLLAGGIPAYRLPPEALNRDLERVLMLGIEVVTGQTVDQPELERLLGSYRSVLLATGTWGAKPIMLPGEDLQGVLLGLDFLLDDARQQAVGGKRVVVIGGGNTAIDAARVALRSEAASVTILYRPDLEALPDDDDEVREAADEGVQRLPAQPSEFLGVSGRISAVRCKGIRWTEGDVIRSAPEGEFPCDVVITAIGHLLKGSSIYRGLAVEADRVVVDSCGRTKRKWLYLAGDAGTTRGTVADALATGKAAALTIHLDLTGQGDAAETATAGGRFSIKDFFQSESMKMPGVVAQVTPYSYLTATEIPAQDQPCLDAKSRIKTFDEVVLSLEPEQAETEATRCFFCGTCIGCDVCATYCPDVSMGRIEGKTAYACNPDYCKGCGACAAVCARGVLTMGEEQ